MEKVLFIKYNLNMDGVTSLFLNMNNYWKDISIDYLIDERTVPEDIEQKLIANGNIYSIQKECFRKCGTFSCLLFKLFYIYQLIRKKKYSIVHMHTGEINRCIILLIAKLAGTKVRIIHSHSSSSESSGNSRKDWLFKRLMLFSATHYFACSDEAAKWMFPTSVVASKNYKIISNGIMLNRFRFDVRMREKYRREMNLIDKKILCTVGRLEKVKNYPFLLEVFAGVLEREPSAVLLFIGDGRERESLQQLAVEKGVKEQVCFLGVRYDIPQLLNMADYFLLTSFFEGLPLTLVEAQVVGLKCFASDVITKQVAITDNINFLSLEQSPAFWVDKLLATTAFERRDYCLEAKTAGFDIESVTWDMETFYLSHISHNC